MKFNPQKPSSFDEWTIDFDFSFVFGLDLKNCPNENWTFKSHEVLDNGVILDVFKIDIKTSSKDGVLFPECEAIVRTGALKNISFKFKTKKNVIRDYFRIIEKHYVDNIRIDNSYTEIKYLKEIKDYHSFGHIDLINGARTSYYFGDDYIVYFDIPYVNPNVMDIVPVQNGVFNAPQAQQIEKVIVFDTETTGLYPDSNDIIQLSYQIVNFNNWRVLKKVNHYFPLPEDKNRIDWEAIQPDRLIKENQGKISFSDPTEALKDFFQDLSTCQLAVAHNFSFDKSFIEATKKRLKIRGRIKWPFAADTMADTTEFCGLYPIRFGAHKYPKLLELATLLHVPFKEDKFHDSLYDVEITKKCFRSLYDLGFYIFRYDERGKNKESVLYSSNMLIYY